MKQYIQKNKIMILIFILAFIVRLGYIIKIPITDKQHDIDGAYGHVSYILTIYETNKLPDTNQGQFYQPPLHHIISAVWLKLFDGLVKDPNTLLESLQVIPLIYSMILLFIINKLLRELKIKSKYNILILTLMAFHPTFIILSGNINNDMLSILLIFYTIYRLIKWYKKNNILNIIILALSTGFAVMAKTSGAIVSLPIIYIFILQFYREIKKEKQKGKTIIKYFKLYFIFGIISLSIGLCYHIRNYILFNQPILYVLDINMQELYVGNYSLIERFGIISKEIFYMYADPWSNYNIPTYLLKTSLFGEWKWNQEIIFQYIYSLALYSNIILIIISIISTIKVLILKNKKNVVYKNLFFLLYIFNIISFISMNIKLPYGCSMDFRYIVPSIFVGAYYTYLYTIYMKDKNSKKMLYNTILITSSILIIASDFILLFS